MLPFYADNNLGTFL